MDNDLPSPPTPEDKKKAARAKLVLYVVMAVFILLPLALYFLSGQGK
ncbi:MAG: hypothetical protein LBI02_04765 [Opitutaceae bacterium]|jgi:hypothetical protein|nr:hypothetical protein [Opitutaceae bacterium]